jgi:radical SAM superfamily enzyme YgiQ (UPF0313 family)
MSQLDLVIIHPANQRDLYQSLAAQLSAIETPVWAGLTATYVRKHGFEVAIIDSEAEQLSPQDVADRVATLNPRLVAICVYSHQPSASTQNMGAAGAIAEMISRQQHVKIIMYGGHVAALPERTLRDEMIDYVAIGEGPETIVQLLEDMGTPDEFNVLGLGIRGDASIYKVNPAPVLIKELDQLMPGPAYDLLDMSKYRAHNWQCFGGKDRSGYASIYTTLGCPYSCTFCAVQSPFLAGQSAAGMKTNSYRYWSPALIGETLEWLVKAYGVKNVRVADEMFVLNKTHVEAICREIITRKLDLNLWAYARVDTVKDDQTLALLKLAGFHWLCFGFESSSQAVRAGVGKGYAAEMTHDVVRRVHAAGIYVLANYIVGLPDDTHETMEQTLQEAIDLNCEFFNLYSAMAYPGSQWYRDAVANGTPLPARWGGYSQHAKDCLPLPTKHLTSAEVLRFRDAAWLRYFDRPEYRSMMVEKFGSVVLDELSWIGQHTLERLHA